MTQRAHAPGKLVVLGEYAVLDGHPALVMAVDRRCRAEIGPRNGPASRLETRMPAPQQHEFAAGGPSGVALVDLVAGHLAPARPLGAWQAVLDTAAFHAGEWKLGLGSSAAALTAWAGAYGAFAGTGAALDLVDLVALHRRFQSGGSGLDVAASFTGGVIVYRLDAAQVPRVGSVLLPNSVGFAGIFAGRSASTPDLVARYGAFSREKPRQAEALREQLGGVAEVGCEAARGNDVGELLDAIAEYGRGLEALGRAIGADVMTPEHCAIAAEARRFGLAYKVSGAGGGDLGLAFSDRPDALAAFEAAVAERGFSVVGLDVDTEGLIVEEQQ